MLNFQGRLVSVGSGPERHLFIYIQEDQQIDNMFNYQQIEEPEVYQNTGPTPEQRNMINFNEYVETETRRAVTEQAALADGTAIAEAFMRNFSLQAKESEKKTGFELNSGL